MIKINNIELFTLIFVIATYVLLIICIVKINHEEKNASSNHDSDMEDIKTFYKGWQKEYLKKLVEEQTPKEVGIMYVCPTCNKIMNKGEDHCKWCGQSIKWN